MNFAIWTSGKGIKPEFIKESTAREITFDYIYVCDTANLDGIKSLAECYSIPVLYEIDKNELIEKYKVDCILLANYPFLIPGEMAARQLFLNGHNSLLPKYRGLHAFTWALINGEKEVGYSLIKVDEGLDSGDILSQVKIPVATEDDINDVFEKADKVVYKWLAGALSLFREGRLTFTPQDESRATYVCKRVPGDGIINWRDSARDINNFIRAQAPPYAPGAFTFYKNEKLTIRKAALYPVPSYIGLCGQVVANLKDKGVLVKCGDGVLSIERIVRRGVEMAADKRFKTVGARWG